MDNNYLTEMTEPAAAEKRERKTYTEEEAKAFMNDLKTTGRKGVKITRINMAFTPDNYDFIKTMSKVSGLTITEFVNRIMQQYMKEHMEQYEKAIEFRNSILK